MTTLRAITLRLPELFNLFDKSIRAIPEEHRSSALNTFCLTLREDHGVSRGEIDECLRLLVFKEDYANGFVTTNGVVRRKETIATRTVLVSHPEEMGENGIMWRDAVTSRTN
jgi:hypothetical protein